MATCYSATMDETAQAVPTLPSPARTLSIGVTGHREGNREFAASRQKIEGTLTRLLGSISESLQSEAEPHAAGLRIVTNLANGSDLLAATIAQNMGIDVQAPLPAGRDLNLALNCLHPDWKLAREIAVGGTPEDPEELRNWRALNAAMDEARCFELADQDEALLGYLDRLGADPFDRKALQEFDGQVAKRTQLASRVTVEHSDILLAVWDGVSPTVLGGTRDTMADALEAGIPVIWLDARDPSRLHWLDDLADLSVASERATATSFDEIVAKTANDAQVSWAALDRADIVLDPNAWKARSSARFHAYRRIEQAFSGDGAPFKSIRQTYETPDRIANGSAREQIKTIGDLPGVDARLVAGIAEEILPGFALADGISTYLSDAYRGGMVASFLLSAAAIIAGVTYLPLVGPEGKWPFALAEFIMLVAIVAITIAGMRGEWHRRWFRTRRAAEYLRHAPILMAIGCMRPKGHLPRARNEHWPELFAWQLVGQIGIPAMRVTKEYLRRHLEEVLRPFLVSQSGYHKSKSARLERVHHNLDRMSETLFVLAIISVGGFLLLKAGSALGWLDPSVPDSVSKLATYTGVAFPTLGAAIASIRYFGDFERFASISDVTSAKLDRLIHRADLLLESSWDEINYGDHVDLARAMDEVVVSEIESWQSIFATKKMSVPV